MISDNYLTLREPGMAETVIQKSRFIGQACPCESEESALSFLRQIREGSRDARHHCYAYILGVNEGIIRYSDDGEPGGTAGMPMISYLRAEKLVNCCVVVTRYFGGILLGTGGLVRAYTEGCRIAVQAAGIVRMERTCLDLCEVPYPFWDSVRYTLDQLPARIDQPFFGSAVSFTLLTRSVDRDHVLFRLNQITSGKMVSVFEEEKYSAWEV